MNSVGELIAFQDPDFILLTKAQRSFVQSSVLLYMFRGCKSQELSQVLVDHLSWSGQDCIDFRAKLASSGYLMKNLKLFFYAKVCESKTSYAEYEVLQKDALLVTKTIQSQIAPALRLVTLLLKLYRKGCARRTLKGFDKSIASSIQDLEDEAFIQKFVGKKFKFLTQSGQLDPASIRAECLEFGLRAAYRSYPNLSSPLHLTNTMKTGIRNRGLNIINEQTTQSRQRVMENADGTYGGRVLSLNFTNFEQTFALEQQGSGGLTVCNSLMSGLDGRSCEYERPQDVDRLRDLRQVVESLYSKVKGEKPRKFIDLLMGEHDPEFSNWLGQPNDEASGKLDRKIYIEKVREYMDVPAETAQGFMRALRIQLSDYRV